MTDNVGITSLSLSQTAYTCANLGTNSVTLTAVDAAGNSASANATVTVIDAIAPTAIAQNITISLSNGTASISGADVNNGSYDNCGIVSMSVSPNSFGCNDGGDHVVTLTVTDASGNSTSTTATVTVLESTPTLSVSGGTTVSGQLSNTIFLGYGPQGIQLNSVANGGSGFTYSWSPSTGLSNPNIANPVASPTVSTTYTLTVTNAGGCSTSESISICVLDIRSVNKKGAFDEHFDVQSFPNPFNSELTVYVDSHNEELVDIKLFDPQGRLVYSVDKALPLTNIVISTELASGVYLLETTQGANKKVIRVVKN